MDKLTLIALVLTVSCLVVYLLQGISARMTRTEIVEKTEEKLSEVD